MSDEGGGWFSGLLDKTGIKVGTILGALGLGSVGVVTGTGAASDAASAEVLVAQLEAKLNHQITINQVMSQTNDRFLASTMVKVAELQVDVRYLMTLNGAPRGSD